MPESWREGPWQLRPGPQVPWAEGEPFNPQRPDWQARAACRPAVIPHVWQQFDDCEGPVDLFFPVVPPSRERCIAIESVCDSCPVRDDCYEHGIAHEGSGWWGGRASAALDAERHRRGLVIDRPEVDDRTRQTIGTVYEGGHGTSQRYARHCRDGERPCVACREANATSLRSGKSSRYADWKAAATEEEREAARAKDRARRARARADARQSGRPHS